MYTCTYTLMSHTLQHAGARCSTLICFEQVLQCIAVFCSVLQCLAVSCSVLQVVAGCCRLLQCSTLIRFAQVLVGERRRLRSNNGPRMRVTSHGIGFQEVGELSRASPQLSSGLPNSPHLSSALLGFTFELQEESLGERVVEER